jgi:cyanophycinase-like exopeptidase
VSSFALLGSGEFEPWSSTVDRWALGEADGDGRVLILPTASAREGDAVFDRWANKGLEHFRGAGVPAEVLRLKTREDASRPELVERLAGASVAYFSGGNPSYLASTLMDTPFWRALRDEMDRGAVYVGCSAGVACLGARAPDSDAEELTEEVWKPGLAVFADTWFGPHWDALDGYVPGLTQLIVSSVPAGGTLLAIDEDTAIVGDGGDWSVVGASGAHVYADGTWAHHASGSSFVLPIG